MNLISNQELLNLKDKVAIVTGGSMGIGYGIVFRLASAGAKVVIASRNLEEAKLAETELTGQGLDVKAVQTDVSKEEDVKNMVAQTISLYGGIDILVNNAGIYPFKTLTELTSEVFEQVININLKGVFYCVKYASEQMIKQGRGGKIINVTSIDALHPSMAGLAAYDASKHGVWGFSKNVALELAKNNISVNAVAPGGVTTPGTNQKPDVKIERNPELVKMEVPMGRMGVPDDIGKVVLFLASDMSSYMTGSQVVVDGGYLLQ